MIQIGDVLVSLDVVERTFVCDLPACKGACCFAEAASGAPLEKGEMAELQKVLPVVWDDLSPEAQAVIKRQGVAYIDSDGDDVVSIVGENDCVFTCYDEKGICRCAIEKAFREGRTTIQKPVSCHLYPIRISRYDSFQAVNYHWWRICKAGELLGRKEGLPVYKFLKEPLIRKFGEYWYEELEKAVDEWNKHRD
ncbi:MAG: DUF3109 family protein [Tannerellaceae bacterium]|jgi:hypothetical protein|nr:DUF3109 family protein [Tannerellaceae bacterium]